MNSACELKKPFKYLLGSNYLGCPISSYHQTLEMAHLPEMVFPKNTLVIEHKNGTKLQFNALDALKEVNVQEKPNVKVDCAQEWQESRPTAECTMPKIKQVDWTFCTKYQGSVGETFKVENTDFRIDLTKLMKKERILFYHDLTLYEDELHDNGISVCSVKIVRGSGLKTDRQFNRMLCFSSESCPRDSSSSCDTSCAWTTYW